MSINSVSSLSFSGSRLYISNIDSEYVQIKNYLNQYGIKPSGDRFEDERVYNMLRSREMVVNRFQEMFEASSQALEKTEKYEPEEYPWTDFMRQLGLEPTGDRDLDKTETITELETRIKSSTSDYDRNYYIDLYNQVDSEFAESGNFSTSVLDYTSAATILGNMNRAFFLHTQIGA